MSSPLLKRVQWERSRRQFQRLQRSTCLLTLVQILLAFYHLALALGSQSLPFDPTRNPNSNHHNNCASFHHVMSNGASDVVPSMDSHSSQAASSPELVNNFTVLVHQYNASEKDSIKNEPRGQNQSKENRVWTKILGVPISVPIGAWFFMCQLLPLVLALFSLFNLGRRCHLLIPVLFLQPINLMVFILVSISSYHVAFQDSQKETPRDLDSFHMKEGGVGRMWVTVGALIIFITTLNLLSWWSYLKLYLNVSRLWPSASAAQPLVHVSDFRCHASRHSPSSDNRSSSTGEDGSSVILMPRQPSPPPSKYQLYRQRANCNTINPPIEENQKNVRLLKMSASNIRAAN